MKLSSQWYQIPYVLHEKRIPLHHGRVAHSLKFNNPKNGQELAKGSNANIDQHKILFLIVHITMGFVRERN